MKGSEIMKKGFTLAEVLITLAIIGVVAALTIPSVILNTNQTEYKTALKKAVSVLNQATSLELAINNQSPSEASVGEASAMLNMIQQHMSTVKTATGNCTGGITDWSAKTLSSATNYSACSFTTTDGIQFAAIKGSQIPNSYKASGATGEGYETFNSNNLGACSNASPCYMLVDVNGDKNPNKMTDKPDAPSDRFILMFRGENGTSVTPAGLGSNVMFGK